MAKRFIQIEGVDYEEPFSPVVRIASIRLLLALIAHLDLEIYMNQPTDFVSKGQEDKVYLLKRSIYGLKQSSRTWYFRFHETIISFNLHVVSEECMSRKLQRGLYVLLYMLTAYYWLETAWR